MPITVTCPKCNKQLRVRDELVGKKLRCPGCGNTFDARAGAGAGAGAAAGKGATVFNADKAAAAKQKHMEGAGKLSISWGPIVLGVFGLLVIVGIIAFVMGPKKVWNEWEQIGGKASDDVQEVVTFALKAQLSQTGEWNPRKPGHDPRADEPQFYRPTFVMSMPDRVDFQGSSTQGEYTGKYNPKTGEVIADVAIDGMSLPSGVTVRKGSQKIHVTGRMKGSQAEAEIDGKKAEIHYPPAVEE